MILVIFLLVIIGGFFWFIISMSAAADRRLKEQRAPVQGQIDGLRMQMQGLLAQSRHLDEKTVARVNAAQADVDAKLNQATTLLSSAYKDRQFERIGRILALVEGKLGNLQVSIGRAQARMDERTQRQADAAQRRVDAQSLRQQEAQQRRGANAPQKAMQRTSRGSFGPPPALVTSGQTSWDTIPTDQRGVCFFCSRPCLLSELTPVTVPLRGQAQRVLACPQDLTSIRAGNLPPIRAFSQNGQRIPWYAYRSYNPYRDYYVDHFDVDIYVDRYPFDVFAPIYWDFQTPYVYDDGPAYIFSPEAEPYQDYMNQQAAGAADMGQNVGGVDYAAPDGAGGVDFSGTEMQGVGGMDYNNTADFADGPDVS